MCQASGTFNPPGPGTYTVSFMPGAGCGVESSATITVDESLPIGSANVPDEMCVNAGILNLVADVARWHLVGSRQWPQRRGIQSRCGTPWARRS